MMRSKLIRGSTVLFLALLSISLYSQDVGSNAGLPAAIADSLRRSGYILDAMRGQEEIVLTESQAIKFLQRRLRSQYWKNQADPLRIAIGQLVFEASHKPFDSAEFFLREYPFDSLGVSWDKFYIWEPLRLRIPITRYPVDVAAGDTVAVSDTSRLDIPVDSSALARYLMQKDDLRPKPVAEMKDTSILVVVDTLHQVSSDYPEFPFTYYEYPYQSDSIGAAVSRLLGYVEARDSTVVYFTGLGNQVTPVWLNSKSGIMHRHWLRTDINDSVTVWIGAHSKNTIALYLERGITFMRPAVQRFAPDARIEIQEVDRSKLQEVKKIEVRKLYWKYRSEASFALNQASLTNWVKGGESNIATSLDITGFADYENKSLKMTSNNFGRLKFGLIWTDENGIRKNLDLLETSSKLNHKAFGKFDFSAILLFKTQLARGYNYQKNDSIPVSKFMNPAIITAGLGLDFKPNKNTSLNFSPLSYKGTFVLDTAIVDKMAGIDQTLYGVPANRRSKHEPGASFMINNTYKPFKTITVTNRLQLFTNYIDNPLNIDIDWEMILTANLNWFTDVRLNTHFIFDDDTKTPVNKEPGAKKTARVQFKELLGFSFIFRF